VIEAYCGRRPYLPGDTATLHVSSNAGAFDVRLDPIQIT
jgi:hypothetical protein